MLLILRVLGNFKYYTLWRINSNFLFLIYDENKIVMEKRMLTDNSSVTKVSEPSSSQTTSVPMLDIFDFPIPQLLSNYNQKGKPPRYPVGPAADVDPKFKLKSKKEENKRLKESVQRPLNFHYASRWSHPVTVHTVGCKKGHHQGSCAPSF